MRDGGVVLGKFLGRVPSENQYVCMGCVREVPSYSFMKGIPSPSSIRIPISIKTQLRRDPIPSPCINLKLF